MRAFTPLPFTASSNAEISSASGSREAPACAVVVGTAGFAGAESDVLVGDAVAAAGDDAAPALPTGAGTCGSALAAPRSTTMSPGAGPRARAPSGRARD